MTSILSCGFDNTLYNAKKYYNSAQGRQLQANGKPSNQAIEEYNKVIKKCGYIITEQKNSPQVDDALFLMAKALFFKGNNQFQAKNAFESLINNFPDSPYVPEATMYLSQINRQINKPKDAQSILEVFILNSKWKKWHSKALFLLTDFAIQDKDFIKAQFWLEKILSQYPRTKEYKEAYFLLGKNLYEQKKYKDSLLQFETLLKAKGISKLVKLDASLYIGLNQFYLGNFDSAWKTCLKLAKNEMRPDKLQQIELLKGRILLHQGKEIEGKALLNDLVKSTPRSALSAEIYWWLAEFDYYNKGDYKSALEAYNKVKTEFSSSEFASKALVKSNALNALNQAKAIKIEENSQIVLDRYLSIVDNYFTVFDQPDSAFAVLDRLISIPQLIQVKLDSLQIEIDSLNVQLQIFSSSDSMSSHPKQDSLSNINSLYSDNLTIKADSLNNQKERADSLTISNKSVINILQKKKESILTQKENLIKLNSSYIDEHIPFIMFVKANWLIKTKADSVLILSLYESMKSLYPNNKYTNALGQLIKGDKVNIIDPELESAEKDYDLALSYLSISPDSTISILNRLKSSPIPEISLKANFRLGWLYSFELPDTTKAKDYLNIVLNKDKLGEYNSLINRFYDGTKFLTFSFVDSIKDSLSNNIDSLNINTPSDSINIKILPSYENDQENNSLKSELDDADPEILTEPFIKPKQE